MFGTGISVPRLLLPVALLLCAIPLVAQHHGAGGGGSVVPGGGLSSYGRPEGVDEKDTLKDFHHAVAVQASSSQIADFQEMIKSTNAAKDRVHASADPAGKTITGGATLDETLDDARTRNKKFQDGFSDRQKSGLREITKRLEKADTDLEQEQKRFEQSVQSGAATEIAARAASLEKALTDFSNLQLALGREMSITLASGEDLAFTLPRVRRQLNAASRAIAMDVSGSLSQTDAQAALRSFQLQTAIDLSELQQAITAIMNAQLSSTSCGPRLTVRRATIMAAAPASSLVLQMHYERWSCTRQTELAEGEGSVEIRLTPAVDTSGILSLTSDYKRIDATGVMGDDLRTGDLGDTVRDKVSAAVLAIVQAAADPKYTLPGVLQNGVTLQGGRFQDSSGSGLKVILLGKVQLSNEQVNLLASQLNQTLSAQGSPTPGSATPPPQPTK